MNVELAREHMIERQVRPWEVLDTRVLDAMTTVRREHFVPAGYESLAFADTAIALPCGQHMLTPKIVGRTLQALALSPADTVLELGTGSAYLTACLATLAGSVHTVEYHAELAGTARARLVAEGMAGVAVEHADATTLVPGSTFDVVVLTASLPVYDPRYEAWLKVGGRLFVVVGEAPAMTATLVTRLAPLQVRRVSLFETVLDPLIHARRPAAFRF